MQSFEVILMTEFDCCMFKYGRTWFWSIEDRTLEKKIKQMMAHQQRIQPWAAAEIDEDKQLQIL